VNAPAAARQSSPQISALPRKAKQPSGDFNSGIRSGLFEKKHSDAMGEAIFLYGWLVTKQTKPNGLVLGGRHLTYEDIAAETGWPRRTLQRWINILQPHCAECDNIESWHREPKSRSERPTKAKSRWNGHAFIPRGGYIHVKHTSYCRMIIWILNPKKKFKVQQLELPISSAPYVAHSKHDDCAITGAVAAPDLAHTGTEGGALKEGSVVGTDTNKNHLRALRDCRDSISSLRRLLKNRGLVPHERTRLEVLLSDAERKLADLEREAPRGGG
jgi:hypothetical protein